MYYVSYPTKRGRPKSLHTLVKLENSQRKSKKSRLSHPQYPQESNVGHTLLSLLYHYHKITKGMFEAGLLLQALNYQSTLLTSLTPLSRKSSIVASIIGPYTRTPYLFESSSTISASTLKAHQKWRHAEKILKRQSMQSYHDIKKIIIDNELPSNWRDQEKINFNPLQIGLRAIEKEFFYSKA